MLVHAAGQPDGVLHAVDGVHDHGAGQADGPAHEHLEPRRGDQLELHVVGRDPAQGLQDGGAQVRVLPSGGLHGAEVGDLQDTVVLHRQVEPRRLLKRDRQPVAVPRRDDVALGAQQRGQQLGVGERRRRRDTLAERHDLFAAARRLIVPVVLGGRVQGDDAEDQQQGSRQRASSCGRSCFLPHEANLLADLVELAPLCRIGRGAPEVLQGERGQHRHHERGQRPEDADQGAAGPALAAWHFDRLDDLEG